MTLLQRGEACVFGLLDALSRRLLGSPIGAIGRGFLRNLSWVSVGGIISAAILFAANALIGRFLGPGEYGKFQVVLSIAQVLMIPMLFGFNTASTRYLSGGSPEAQERIRSTALSFVVLLTGIFSAGFFFASRFFFREESETVMFGILFAAFFSFFFLFRSFLQGYQKMKLLSLADTAYSLVVLAGVTLAIFFLPQRNTFDFIAISFLAGYAVFIGFAAVSLFGVFSRAGQWFHETEFRLLFRYGLLATAGSVSGALLGSVDRLILAYAVGDEAVGIYAVYALVSVTLFSQLVQIFVTALFPALSAAQEKHTLVKKIGRLSLMSFLAVFFGSIPLMFLLLSLFGSSYPLSLTLILFFSLYSGLSVAYQIKMWFLNAEGPLGVRATVIGVFSCGILNLALNLLLIPLYSVEGAVFSLLISSTVLNRYFSLKMSSIFSYGTRTDRE